MYPICNFPLAKIIGVRDEDGSTGNSTHFGNGAPVVRDMMQDTEGTHDIEGIVVECEREKISSRELAFAQPLGVTDFSHRL